MLLDTNAYLRLAKRVQPLLGVKFGHKEYVITILKIIEDEVHRSPRLKFLYPWFNDPGIAQERFATRLRLSLEEKEKLEAATSVLRAHVLSNLSIYKNDPPSETDCYILAFGQIRPAIIATDDLGMHQLSRDFGLHKMVWHGHELLQKLRSAKQIDNALVREIYEALEINDDLPKSWRAVKHTTFKKIFGPEP